MSILIVGGDSRLSETLYPMLKSRKYSVFKTSRRINNHKNLFLDFNKIDNFDPPKNIEYAVIIGGVTSYDTCEDNYDYAHKINCINIPELIRKFLANNIYVIYISTNTVFMKSYSHPNENEVHNPGSPYAILKSKTEEAIIKISQKYQKENKLSILRLTKNVSLDTSPFNQWYKNIYENKPFNAFNDLYFCPISFDQSSEAIIKIIEKKAIGIFHISGENDLSYSQFGKGLLKFFNKDEKLCIPINSKDIGVKLRYNHFYTSLNMKYTSSILGINYVPIEEIYKIFERKI